MNAFSRWSSMRRLKSANVANATAAAQKLHRGASAGDAAAVAALWAAAERREAPLRRAASQALARLDVRPSVNAVVPLLQDADGEVREAGIRMLGASDSPAAVPHLVKCLVDPAARLSAIRALGELREKARPDGYAALRALADVGTEPPGPGEEDWTIISLARIDPTDMKLAASVGLILEHGTGELLSVALSTVRAIAGEIVTRDPALLSRGLALVMRSHQNEQVRSELAWTFCDIAAEHPEFFSGPHGQDVILSLIAVLLSGRHHFEASVALGRIGDAAVPLLLAALDSCDDWHSTAIFLTLRQSASGRKAIDAVHAAAQARKSGLDEERRRAAEAFRSAGRR